MKKPIVLLAAASALGVPAAGSAQVFEGVFLGFGLAGHHYPEYEYGLGLGLARVAAGRSLPLPAGVQSRGRSRVRGRVRSLLRQPWPRCRRPSLRLLRLRRAGPPLLPRLLARVLLRVRLPLRAGPTAGGWHDHWYRPTTVVFGWPRFHFDRYSFGPYWRDPYHDWWGYRGWDPYWGYQRYRTAYVDYDRGYGRTRVATRSPCLAHATRKTPGRPSW